MVGEWNSPVAWNLSNSESYLQNLPYHAPIRDLQPAERNRQLESFWPRAAGVEIQHTVFGLLLGLMAVAADYGRETRSLWVQIKRVEVVENVDVQTAEFYNLGF